MTDQIQSEAPQQQPAAEETVSISKSELENLKAQLQEMQALLLYQQRARDEAPSPPPPPPPTPEPKLDVDLDELTPKQLYEHIKQTMIAPIVQTLVFQQVQQEVAQVERKYPDFNTYRPYVKDMLMQNPTMSIEDAYLIVKQKVGKVPSEPAQPQQPKEAPKPPVSSKPGMASATTSEREDYDLREAALKAVEELTK